MKDWQDKMKVKVVTVSPYDSVRKAYEIMNDRVIRHLLVTDGGTLHGIVSDRDILKVVDIDENGIPSYPHMTIDQIMITDLKTCDYNADTEEICKTLLDNHIDCVPIVDGDEIKGLITSRDLVALLLEIDRGKNRQAFDFGIAPE